MTNLRKEYVEVVCSATELKRDKTAWMQLLQDKGTHIHMSTLTTDFPNSYKVECIELDVPASQWTDLMTHRRNELGVRVNDFVRTIQQIIGKIPDSAEMLLLENACAISKDLLSKQEESGGDTDTSSKEKTNSVRSITIIPYIVTTIFYCTLF